MGRRSVMTWSVVILALLATAALAGSHQPCDEKTVEAHGVVRFIDVEGGCWQFEDDDGSFYQPIGGPDSMYCDGVAGNLLGCLPPDVVSTCQVGTVVKVLQFDPDPFTVHGTMHFIDVEGGCWQFLADDGTPYEPVCGPPGMFVDGVTGSMTAFELCLLGSFCQVGQLVQVVQFVDDNAGCSADLDGNGMVNVHDLLALIFAWGSPAGDLNGDHVTDVIDLLLLLWNWGPCDGRAFGE